MIKVGYFFIQLLEDKRLPFAQAEGFRHLGLKDDHEILEKEFIVYDALYAYCRQRMVLEQR